MKKLLLYLLVSLPLFSLAQKFKPDQNTKSTFTDQPSHLLDTVIESKLTQKQLYSNSLNYISTSFKDSRNVLEMKDIDLGEISFIGTYSTIIVDSIAHLLKKKTVYTYQNNELKLKFKCKIYVKDQKAKIVLSSLLYDYYINKNTSIRIGKELEAWNGNRVASELALDLIKRIAGFINKKPDNDF